MKFFDVVLISLVVGFSIIGLHQSIILGLGNSYWIFMLTLVLLLWFKIRNTKGKETASSKDEVSGKGKSKGKKQRGK